MDQWQGRATEAMTAASWTMTAFVATTLSEVSGRVTAPQLRVMVLLSSHGPMNFSTLAQLLEVNASNVSRTCDQLVADGRVVRQPNARDRRTTDLRLTENGARFVAELTTLRRRLVEQVVSCMDHDDQQALARGLEAFFDAVGSGPPREPAGAHDGRIIPWLL
jgi:DNA-binding MarR family transcriptional regulator